VSGQQPAERASRRRGRLLLNYNHRALNYNQVNNPPNALHGGEVGFDKRLWSLERSSATEVSLKLEAADGEEGYPGNLTARVTYSLRGKVLRVEYSATSDAATPVNLTNHAYWNLADGGATPVLDHTIALAADHYIPVDDGSAPTGEVRKVSGAMDLRAAVPVGKGILQADNGMGCVEIPGRPSISARLMADYHRRSTYDGGHFSDRYDHCYCLSDATAEDGLRLVARVSEKTSGR
jgi:aldose 1-epimerase